MRARGGTWTIITIDSRPLTVAGILPAEFRFPDWNTQIWRATSFDDPASQPNQWPIAYVRFASNVPRTDALKLATTAAVQAGAAANLTALISS